MLELGGARFFSCAWPCLRFPFRSNLYLCLHLRSPSLGLRVYCVQVTGPSLTPAQSKFLEVLLRAPTLSYPGGLFMLQAFRGRSGKEVVARYECTLGCMYDDACLFWEVLKAFFFFSLNDKYCRS